MWYRPENNSFIDRQAMKLAKQLLRAEDEEEEEKLVSTEEMESSAPSEEDLTAMAT